MVGEVGNKEEQTQKYRSCLVHFGFYLFISLFLICFQEIIPEKSSVKMLGTKVEINLKKAEAFSWPTLEFPPETTNGDSK